jgi:hypothetical protein
VIHVLLWLESAYFYLGDGLGGVELGEVGVDGDESAESSVGDLRLRSGRFVLFVFVESFILRGSRFLVFILAQTGTDLRFCHR